MNFLDKVWKMLALVTVGYAGWRIYKMCNPKCAHDIEKEVEKLTKKMQDVGKNIENMM